MWHSGPSSHLVKVPHGVRLRGTPGDNYDDGLAAMSKQRREGVEERATVLAGFLPKINPNDRLSMQDTSK